MAKRRKDRHAEQRAFGARRMRLTHDEGRLSACCTQNARSDMLRAAGMIPDHDLKCRGQALPSRLNRSVKPYSRWRLGLASVISE